MNCKGSIIPSAFLQEFSPYDDLEINEEHMTKETMEKNASPLAPFDPILHCAEAFQKGGSWPVPPNFNKIHQ